VDSNARAVGAFAEAKLPGPEPAARQTEKIILLFDAVRDGPCHDACICDLTTVDLLRIGGHP